MNKLRLYQKHPNQSLMTAYVQVVCLVRCWFLHFALKKWIITLLLGLDSYEGQDIDSDGSGKLLWLTWNATSWIIDIKFPIDLQSVATILKSVPIKENNFDVGSPIQNLQSVVTICVIYDKNESHSSDMKTALVKKHWKFSLKAEYGMKLGWMSSNLAENKENI